MKRKILAACLLVPACSAFADWPQWRGPTRDGVAGADAGLTADFSEDRELKEVWRVEGIPSDHDGGHGSPSVCDGRVFLGLVWHRDVPTETRKIDRQVLNKLGYRNHDALPAEVVAEMETERMSLGRRLRGKALDEWAKQWVAERLDEKTRLKLGDWIVSRFRQGRTAIPLPVFETLATVEKRTFASHDELESWLDEQDFDPEVRRQILEAVPATRKAAQDVVLCYDAKSGKELWKFEVEGEPAGRAASSTPACVDGKVFAALSDHLYCLDAESGRELWRAGLSGKSGPASSPLVADGRVYLQENKLSCFDAATGELVWDNPEVKGSNASPVRWKDRLLCNSNRELLMVDAGNGEIIARVPGGGSGTPVIAGDVVVANSKGDEDNLAAYRMTAEGLEKMWGSTLTARRYDSSPLVAGGQVYYLGSTRHLCLDLETGSERWSHPAQSEISSPLLAGGRLLVYENKGGFLAMIAADPAKYRRLGRAKVNALRCASPVLSKGHLYIRTPDGLVCFEAP